MTSLNKVIIKKYLIMFLLQTFEFTYAILLSVLINEFLYRIYPSNKDDWLLTSYLVVCVILYSIILVTFNFRNTFKFIPYLNKFYKNKLIKNHPVMKSKLPFIVAILAFIPQLNKRKKVIMDSTEKFIRNTFPHSEEASLVDKVWALKQKRKNSDNLEDDVSGESI